ncbi:MAG: tRNA (adenosine(37)-N6)-dimethylallyltransferase MiaA [Desulfuromonadales bacterium]|nr:tRNA (adenosine(37)-N6)-dimethylallyltransferase MiaA [Desulfuromonadales bacterium]NIS43951.1 tRNA (adenosine(37)-N6)-dimethylallyltransferase MiaA [Desulfuromonadales bacterium]
MNDINLLVILGPTASGKTALGVQAARALGGEIVSADSRQVFRRMDIGTGKDLAEYAEIPYHLIDIAEPGSEFSVFEFQRRFFEAFSDIRERGKLPVMVGGTGLYLEAVLQGYRMVDVPENPTLRKELTLQSDDELRERLLRLRPDQHNVTDLQERERLVRAIEIAEGTRAAERDLEPLPELKPAVFGLRWERTELRRRIRRRLLERLDQGMVEEAQRLLDAGLSHEALEYYGLEYRYLSRHLRGELNRNDMVQKLAGDIGRFAKRQVTWFRRMERRGTVIHWLDPRDEPLAELLSAVGWSAPDSP